MSGGQYRRDPYRALRPNLTGVRGYDADWFRDALTERSIAPCIPSKANRKVPIPHDRTLNRQRHKIENMFGKLNDWRHPHQLRPLRPRLHVRYLHRRHRHLLGCDQ